MAHIRSIVSFGTLIFALLSTACSSGTEQIPGEFITPPAPVILFGPAAATQDLSATFVFESTQADLTKSFECRIDEEGFSACSSPKFYQGLPEGLHRFELRVIDTLGDIAPKIAGFEWAIDLTAPETMFDSSPATLTNGISDRFEFGSNETGVTFECRLAGSDFTPCNDDRTYVALPTAHYQIDVKSTDAAGNIDDTPASFEWDVDADAPGITISSQPAALTASTSAHFEFSCNDSTPLECILDGGAPAPCSPVAPSKIGMIDYSNVPSGDHAFEVRTADSVGNVGSAAHSWRIDTTAPQTSFDPASLPPAPPGVSNQPFVSFVFAADDAGSTFECSFDGSQFASCRSGARVPASGSLPETSHTFQVYATNPLGMTDASPASHTWTVDLTKPDVSLSIIKPTASPTKDRAAEFDVSTSDPDAKLKCSLDAAAFSDCPAPNPVPFSNLPDGAHTMTVKSVDKATNESSPESFSWSVDTTPPDTSFAFSPPNPDYDTQPKFTFAATEIGAKFSCGLDLAGRTPLFGDCGQAAATEKTVDYVVPSTALLVSGTYTMEVKSRDSLDNEDGSPAAYTWTINTAGPPSVLSLDPPNTAKNVELNKIIKVTFTHKMRCNTINNSSFTVTSASSGTQAGGTVTCNGGSTGLATEATFTPSPDLLHRTTYNVGLATVIRDMNGVSLPSTITIFETRDHRFTAPVQISSNPGVRSLQIKTGMSRYAIAIWEENGNIMARKYSGTWQSAMKVYDGSSSPGSSPHLAMKNDGDAFAVWSDGNNILGATYNGTIWTPFSGDIDNTSLRTQNPYVAMAEVPNSGTAGDAVILWEQQESSGNTQYHVWARRYVASDSTPWRSPEQIDGSAVITDSPRAVMFPDNSIRAVWRRHIPGQGTLSLVEGRNCCDSNGNWDGITAVNDPVNRESVDGLQLSIGDNKTVYAVWSEGEKEVWGARKPNSDSWRNPKLAQSAFFASSPQIIVFPFGNARSIWLEATSTSEYSIQTKQYDDSKDSWDASPTKAFDAVMNDAPPQQALDSRNVITVVRGATLPSAVESRRNVSGLFSAPKEVLDSSRPATQPHVAVIAATDNAIVVYATPGGIFAAVQE